jgi:hypothetical protein
MDRGAGLCAVAVAAAVLLSASAVQAQTKAFKISGEGVGPAGLPLPGEPAREHWIVGNATHLGLHFGEGSVKTDNATLDADNGIITGEFGSGEPFVFEAANGDKLACHFGRVADDDVAVGASEPGTFVLAILGVVGVDDMNNPILLVEADWLAEFVPQPELCTGRFAGIQGSWIMHAWSEPFILGSNDPVYYGWEGQGKLTFQKKKTQ